MIKLLKLFRKKDFIYMFLVILLIAFQVWLDLKIPDYMTNITRLVKTEGTEIKDVLKEGIKMLSCAFGSLISSFIVGYITSYLAATFSKRTRKALFEKVQGLSMEDIKKYRTSSLITRSTNDITHIQMFIAMGLQMIIKAPITAVWAIFKILGKGWQWSLVTALCVIFLLIVVLILMLTVIPKFKITQKLIDNINNITRENLNGIRVIRAFNAEKYQEKKFEKANDDLTRTQKFTQKVMAIMSPIMYLVMNLLTLLIYIIGTYLLDSSSMYDRLDIFSNMVVFSSYAMQVIISFLMLAFIFMIYPRASVSAKRINEVLEEKEKIIDGCFEDDTFEKGILEFRNVSFKYPDADDYVLENISFKVERGKTLAIIGSTGSGKSTIVNLIMRFYDVTKGSILVDGVDVKDYKQEYLHEKLGYVPQKAVIFDESVKYNISYGKKLDEERIKNAANISQADEFIEKMENKYDTNIASGGTNISGGQKQRISIARAISKEPEILIFDDSFSALDYKTDYLVRKALKKHTKDITNVIIAQRIGTIINADIIVVLEKGKMVGIGTHKELLKKCKVYKEIALSQVTKEELENE